MKQKSKIIFFVVLVSTLIILINCTTKIYYRSPLFQQRLVVRPQYPGYLTNQICLEYKKGECTNWDLDKHDLTDPVFREHANKLKISCRVGEQYWRICLDKPGYCRRTLKCVKKVLWHCKKYEELYLDAKEEHDFLIRAGTYCVGGMR